MLSISDRNVDTVHILQCYNNTLYNNLCSLLHDLDTAESKLQTHYHPFTAEYIQYGFYLGTFITHTLCSCFPSLNLTNIFGSAIWTVGGERPHFRYIRCVKAVVFVSIHPAKSILQRDTESPPAAALQGFLVFDLRALEGQKSNILGGARCFFVFFL